MKEVVVTCGGTSEPLDDVRALTNFSTGRFGHTLAAILAENPAYRVREYSPKSTLERLGARHLVDHTPFRTTEDLRGLLLDREDAPAIHIQAAAVSDYRPIPTEGKISSAPETLTITLEKTPKLLASLRKAYGPKTFLVGFKLLSGVSQEELIAAARKQLQTCRLNMVVANDLQNIRDGQHPVIVVTAEGGEFPLAGSREEVARALASLIVKRENVSWFRSQSASELVPTPATEQRFRAALDTAKAFHLLTDASGNISVRDDEKPGSLLVSPRGTDKAKLTLEQAIPVQVDLPARILNHGRPKDASAARPGRPAKPSIDTGMEALIYRAFPNVSSVIHFHRGWGRMATKTAYPYPCGAVEEATDVIGTVVGNGTPRTTETLSVELIHHGFLLGLSDRELVRLWDRWNYVREEFEEHLREVSPTVPRGSLTPVHPSRYQPIWDGVNIAGVIHANPKATAVYLTEDSRKLKMGRGLVEQLITRRHTIQTVDACGVRDFYKAFGFTETEDRGVFRLAPPPHVLTREFSI